MQISTAVSIIRNAINSTLIFFQKYENENHTFQDIAAYLYFYCEEF